ncbi:auxin-responsive protein IAA4-like isoform X1 [Typha latifolia]|uniref:auxin-responsive protein IAA4-like isoform X1 n=1 Tax=Typha latifolia TaxID=4733 RepID=UPI003C2FF46B
MGGEGDSPSSSIDSSSSHPGLSSTSALSQPRSRDLTTELRLGLSLSPSSLEESSLNSRDQQSDWPPIKPLLRSTLSEKSNQDQPPTFFVKVYMEGIPIGRKLDLFSHDGYNSLIRTLCRMFRTDISYPDMDHMPSNKTHVLTYEDKEGDWMMVGDVPWELFLTTVKRLMISRADKC